MQDPRDPSAEPSPDEGMLDLETYERLHGSDPADAEGDSTSEEDDDRLPSVSERRLRELKDQARRGIESRLKARRTQRRLMRGGEQ